MNIEALRELLLWCAIINYLILMIWFLVFKFARSVLFGIHGRWFKLSNEEFDSIHYRTMAQYKIGVLLFNLSPYLALLIVGK